MDATARRRRPARITRGLATCCACIVAALQLTAAPAAWSATSAVSSATVDPPAFVPDWDGHTDSTVLTYELGVRSDVTIRVLDARGGAVATMRLGARDAGRQHAAWDGRDDSGSVVAPGSYTMRVDATPAPAAAAAGLPGAAALGGSPSRAGARAATVTIRRSEVVLTGVALSRASVGAKGRSGSTSARFHLSQAAAVSAAVVDRSGAVVRTLAARRMRAGTNGLSWNARHDDGREVADGQYALVVAATGGGRPTDTMRLPLTVDRAVPTIRATRRVTALLDSRGRVQVPLRVTSSEAATLGVQLGRRSHRAAVRAGAGTLRIDGDRLGLRAERARRTVTLVLRLVDAAGNQAVARTTVVVPPLARRQPIARPTPVDPGPRTPAASGTWPWPVGGIVTSEFGLRDGRPHTGIDIGVPSGTPIHPAAAGTVSFVGVLGGYGNLVIVAHANGMRTYYAHLSSFGGFAVGDAVNHVDTLGLAGCTGNCSGPHLHFETRAADIPQDPRLHLTARA